MSRLTKIFFLTNNEGKFKEAYLFLKENYSIEIEHLKGLDIPEIQADDLEDIARFSLEWVLKFHRKSQFLEDSGLFIENLNGFPGPYSSYVYKKIGNTGILNILSPWINKNEQIRAYFKAVIAYYDLKKDKIEIFTGITRGTIAKEIRGKKGWGFDPIFIPDEGDGRTFAEMGTILKNKYSHRSKALRKLGEYLTR